jgi:hypothetical protein
MVQHPLINTVSGETLQGEFARLKHDFDLLSQKVNAMLADDTLGSVQSGPIFVRHLRKGLAAALPTDDQGRAGDIYWATDTGVLSLHDGTVWHSIQLDAGHLYTDTQITHAQILTLRATPITLVAAPGADKATIVDWVWFWLAKTGSSGYTETDDNLAVEYADGTDIMVVETTGFVDGILNEGRVARPAYAPATPFEPISNSAVQLFNNGDGEFGGGIAGQTLSVRVYYRVVDMAAFS